MVLLRKIFHILFSEKMKSFIRKRFNVILEFFDRIIVYKEYKKACRYILWKKVFKYDKDDYGYRHDKFMEYIQSVFVETKIMYERFPARDDEMQRCIEYVKEKGANVYCGSLDGVKIYSLNEVFYSEENKLFYGLYNGKKLYFNYTVDTEEKALAALNGLAAEQTENSPHRYLEGDFQVEEGDVVFDVGCADGNFALSIIDKASKIYLFEADECWMKPLRLTFEPYMDKVQIVEKYVTSMNNEKEVSLDVFCKENAIENIDLVKMDVEGYEKNVLQGANNLIKQKRIRKVVACTYHKLHDEECLGRMLSDYDIVPARGYMLGALIHDIYDVKPPYFTKGLIRATLKN